MKKNPLKTDVLKSLIALRLYRCRTILHFIKQWIIPACFLASMIACDNSTVNHNGIKNINSNANLDRRGSGGGGTGDGGGGQGVFCSNEVKDPRLQGRLLVRDIYEATINYGRTMKSVKTESYDSNRIAPESFKIITDSVKHYFGPSSKNFDFADQKFWIGFEKRIFFIKDETPLQYSQDANSPISLPEGCEIVQIAFWHEASGPSEEGVLYVDQKYWQKLDQLNKVALLVHEFFFKQARQAGFKNSDFIREKVGQLLSVEGLDPIFEEWVSSNDTRVSDMLPNSMKGFKYCTGESPDDISAKIQFYQYEGKDGLQHFALPLVESNFIGMSLLQKNHFSFDPKTDPELARITDLMVVGSDFWKEPCISQLCRQYERKDLDDGNVKAGFINGNEDWFKLLYDGREFLNFDGEMAYQAASKRDISDFVSFSKPVSWSVHINSASQATQISLSNPGFNFDIPAEEKMKSREELIKIVNNEIVAKFKEQGWSDAFFSYVEYHGLPLSYLAVLNNEIDRAIQSGTYPKGFPRWNEKLKGLIQLDNKKKNDLISDKDRSEFKYSEDISLLLPDLLYKLKINIYDKKDFVKAGLFSDSVFLENGKRNLVRGKIFFRQGTATLNFNLNCKGYGSLYSSATARDIDVRSNKKMNPNIEIVDDEDGKIEDVELTKLLNAVASINNEHDMFELTPYVGQNCRKESNFIGLNCEDFISLSHDLNTERKIVSSACTKFSHELVYFDSYALHGEAGRNKYCTVLRLESSKNSYLAYIQVGDKKTAAEGKQQILFIKKIPFGFESYPGWADRDEHEHVE